MKNTCLINKIKNLQKDLYEYVPCLNSGGCGRFVYYMAKKLEDLNIPYSICYGNLYRFLGEIKLTLKEFEVPSHIFLYVRNIGYFDGYTFIKNPKKTYIYYKNYKSSLQYLHKYINNYEWNCMYEITYDESVKKLINKHIHG